ncbi:unnamed protein product [Prunus brigantina]
MIGLVEKEIPCSNEGMVVGAIRDLVKLSIDRLQTAMFFLAQNALNCEGRKREPVIPC